MNVTVERSNDPAFRMASVRFKSTPTCGVGQTWLPSGGWTPAISGGSNWMKFAVTDLSSSIVTVQVPVPEHPPMLQPVKVESVDAVAVKVTLVL